LATEKLPHRDDAKNICLPTNTRRLEISSAPIKNAVVISDVYGQRGGAYRVTSLLCQTLAELGFRVTCFATWVDTDSLTGQESFSIVRPLIRRGYRWDIPNRILAWQASRFIHKSEATAVFVVGLTGLCGYLLSSRVAGQLLVWELTNANPDNKFVSPKAAELLHRCRAVLSPAKVIDENIRETYEFPGEIKRLPFWIEDEQLGYTPPPEKFRADFLFLARREDDKGLRELIEATALLRKDHPKIRVLIGGPGDETPYRAQAERLGVSEQIEFCSLPSRNDAMNALSVCRYLVLPSYHEGYPLSLLEAAQRSVPFIASAVGSIHEVFSDCTAFTLIPAKNTQALKEAMHAKLVQIDSDYEAARRMGYETFCKLSSPKPVMGMLNMIFGEMNIGNTSSQTSKKATQV
jgi:glycosyltransferase involved in cell wall biosynthesis